MQNFRQLGAHALAQACRENDDVERHALDSSGNSTLLSEELASAFARVALANTEREYPRAVAHHSGRERRAGAEESPPAFFGSYDWHSAVHMHWLLTRVLRLYPMLPENGRIAALLDAHLSPAAIEASSPISRPTRSSRARTGGRGCWNCRPRRCG